MTITEAALDVMRQSLAQGSYDPEKIAIRLRLAGGELRPRFTGTPEPGDEVAEFPGLRVFVDPALKDLTVDVSPEHQKLIVI